MKFSRQNANVALDWDLPFAPQSTAGRELARRLQEGRDDCLMILDREGAVRWLSGACRQRLQLGNAAEALGRDWAAFWRDEDRPPASEALAQARAGGVGRFEGLWGAANGKLVWWDAMVRAILDEQGRPEWLLAALRDVTRQHESSDALGRMEWLLRGGAEPEPARKLDQPYGDLSQLNSSRLILDAVGEPMLREIASDYLDLLQTSTAIYEKNGDYAMGLFSSGWCRFMDQSSRDLCRTGDNREALDCGRWACHECCWQESAKKAIETGGPVDIECQGGIRLYALPIRAGEEIVGAINFGYGDPPRDPAALQQLAERYGASVEELRRQAQLYESRPPFLVELAKRRLATSARLIGEIVRRKQAETERQASEFAFRDLFESASDVILMLDREGRILDINPHAVRLTGYTRQELLGRDLLRDIVVPEDRQKIAAMFSCLLQGERQRYEVRWRAKDGRILCFEGISTACMNESGVFRNTRCILRDVTERKKAEEALRSSEKKFRAIFNQAAMGIGLTDLEGHILMANQKYCEIIGRAPEEIRQLTIADFTHPDDVAASLENIRRVRSGEIENYAFPKRYVRPDGSVVWCQLSVSGVSDEEGRLRYTLGVIEDISERKRSEQELREREERLRILTNNLPWTMVYQVIFEPGQQRRFSFVSASVERLHEVTAEAVLADPTILYEQIHPDFLPGLSAAEAEAERTMSEFRYEALFRLPSGRMRWAELSSTPRRLPGGQLIWDGVEVDLTERKQSEEALLRFRSALDSAVDNIFLVDPEEVRFLDVSQSACDALGYSREELLRMGPSEIAPLLGREDLAEKFRQIISQQGGHGLIETVHRRKDGTQFDVEVLLRPIRNPDGRMIMVAVARDITERKRTEAALRGIVEGTSQATGEQFFRNLVQRLAQTLGVCCAMVAEVDKLRPSRARTLAMWSCNEFVDNAEYELVGTPCADILTRTACHYFHHVADLFPRDEALRTMGVESYVGMPLRDSAGNVLGLIAIMHDRPLVESQLAESMLAVFSARAATELERLQAERELSDASRRKDEFLAMLGHELRNPLAPIRNTVYLLRQGQESLPPRVERGLDVINRQADHLTRLVDDLLDMARITRGAIELKKVRTSLAEAIARAIEMTAPQIEARGHALTTTLPPRSVFLEADPVRLTQIFGNLLDNAAKYTEPGGRITLDAALEGSEAVVRVRDTGMGIPPEMQRHVFDLFAQGARTLDRSQGGLGLGLTLVRQLCLMHGGSVSVFSEGPGQGSEFTVRLPLLVEPPANGAQAAAREPHPANKAGLRRVLVVDDVADTAESLAELIRLWDYHVSVALDGPAALDAARRLHPEVVLLDIGLPGMDGYEVARQIRRDPATASAQVVALTGYGQEEDRKAALNAGFDHHLVKPVDLEALRRLLEA